MTTIGRRRFLGLLGAAPLVAVGVRQLAAPVVRSAPLLDVDALNAVTLRAYTLTLADNVYKVDPLFAYLKARTPMTVHGDRM